jgi:hypothetical protein
VPTGSKNASQGGHGRFRDMQHVKCRTAGRSRQALTPADEGGVRHRLADRARTAALHVECRSTLRAAGGVVLRPTGCLAASEQLFSEPESPTC